MICSRTLFPSTSISKLIFPSQFTQMIARHKGTYDSFREKKKKRAFVVMPMLAAYRNFFCLFFISSYVGFVTGLEETRKNIFRGERVPLPPKRGRGFSPPPNIWSREDLSPVRDICGILRRFAAFCGVLRRRKKRWR